MESLILDAYYSDTFRQKAPHFHDCHQLIYVSRGEALFTVQGTPYRARPGTLVLISRFEEHAIAPLTADYCRYALHISPDFSSAVHEEPLLSVLVNRPKHFQHAADLSGCPEAEPLLKRILQERSEDRAMVEKMQNLLLLQLLLLLCRTHPQLLSQQADKLHLIRQVQAYFENNYQKECSLSQLAQGFHISESHLSHLFKSITGSSVMGYLTHCRLAAAKRYLAETDLEIGKIVELCGFSDNSNFSRSFKAATAMSPTQFRQQFRAKIP